MGFKLGLFEAILVFPHQIEKTIYDFLPLVKIGRSLLQTARKMCLLSKISQYAVKWFLSEATA